MPGEVPGRGGGTGGTPTLDRDCLASTAPLGQGWAGMGFSCETPARPLRAPASPTLRSGTQYHLRGVLPMNVTKLRSEPVQTSSPYSVPLPPGSFDVHTLFSQLEKAVKITICALLS